MQTRFNSQRDGILLARTMLHFANMCFNSQRDGILPKRQRQSGGSERGFNSQRDGILLCNLFISTIDKAVSIPNGMEFYAPLSKRSSRVYGVSIPNGMEFYLDMTGDSYIVQFQFPTGWNSTRAFCQI